MKKIIRRMKSIITIILIISLGTNIYSQKNARYGYNLAPYDTIRFFIVFAEMVDDPNDPGSLWGWSEGEMPDHPEKYCDYKFVDENSINGEITKYFYQASFGESPSPYVQRGPWGFLTPKSA